jgi:polyhydroxyalkanoate synthase
MSAIYNGGAARAAPHDLSVGCDVDGRWVDAIAPLQGPVSLGSFTDGTCLVFGLEAAPYSRFNPSIDFASPGGILALLAGRLLKPALLLDGRGLLPAAVIREAFHSIRPRAIRSVLHGLRARRDPVARTYHAALARWAWEQRPMPGALFFDLVDLCRSNAIVAGTCDVGGRPVDLGVIETPLLSVVASRDHIVPAGSATALGVPSVSPAGHVSMLAGSAATTLHPRLLGWIAGHEAPRALAV